MLFFVERHQHFAKQVVTTSLLIFGAMCVYIKMPKENHVEDNIVIQTIKSLPFLDNFCWFELIFMLKSVIYPNVFHCALHISRIIDKPPEEMIAAYTRDASKHLTKALTSLEMITGSRKLD